MKRILSLLTLSTIVLWASASNHYVSQATGDDSNDGLSWSSAMKTMAQGFGACSDGDTLFVAAGTYNECVTITTNKFVSIIGGYDAASGMRDPEAFQTIMDGTDLGKCLIKAEAEPTIPLLFDGLVLQNSEYASSGSASYMRGNMTLNNCIIRNCHSQSAAAIYAKQDNKNLPCVISNCLIELCTAASSAITGCIILHGPHHDAQQTYTISQTRKQKPAKLGIKNPQTLKPSNLNTHLFRFCLYASRIALRSSSGLSISCGWSL